MITNKRLKIHLSLACLLLLGACGGKIINDQPQQAPEQQSSPPPEQAATEAPVQSEPQSGLVVEDSQPVPIAEERGAPAVSPIRDGIPDRYVVKKGDTLWDIAKYFLKDPWLWPEVWHVNPKIRNPHLIYPGDVLALTWRDGRPQISLEGAEPAPPLPNTNLPTVKLSPSARSSKLNRAIDTIPKSAIAAFLRRPFIISPEELDKAPYIVSNYGDNIISGRDAKIYVRPIADESVVNFNIVRRGRKYIDPDTRKLLGYEAINLGTAKLQKLGDPATMTVTKAYKEILKGDMLVPIQPEELDLNFYPRAPKKDIAGRIISVAEGVAKIGQFQVVVINRGAPEGLEAGHVLEIHRSGKVVKDPRGRFRVRLPEERAGLLMIFKPDEHVSYGLVMEAFEALEIYDYVYTP